MKNKIKFLMAVLAIVVTILACGPTTNDGLFRDGARLQCQALTRPEALVKYA